MCADLWNGLVKVEFCCTIPGTDATHAEHIETIKSRSYVGVRPDGRLVPGQLGMGLVEGLYCIVLIT